VLGLMRGYEEADWLLRRMAPVLDGEAHANGWQLLALSSLGPAVLLSKVPIRTLAELRAHTFWRWNGDQVGGLMWREMGLRTLQSRLDEANQAYDEGRVDGFVVIPQAALAFQMATRTPYLVDFRSAFLTGCLLVASRSFDKLAGPERDVVRAAAAKMAARIDAISRLQDEQLLGGLFAKQGVRTIEAAQLEKDFLAEARRVRDSLADRIAAPETLRKILAILAEYYAERSAR
jgi:TRAP-type C4-dicarboxylate transport system substrate-binding protein